METLLAPFPRSVKTTLIPMLLIFGVALAAHWGVYWLIVSDRSEGPAGYFFGLELILFSGHVPFATVFLSIVFFLALTALIFFTLANYQPATQRRGTSGHALLLTLALLSSTAASYGIEAAVERLDRNAPTQTIDLDSASSADPRQHGFIALSGWQQSRYAAGYWTKTPSTHGYDHTRSHHFVPAVSAEWTPASPIKYVVHSVDQRIGEDTSPPAKEVTTGELSRHLPLYVRWQMEKKGLQIDPSFAVVERVATDGAGHRIDPKRRDTVLIVGLALTVPLALVGLLGFALSNRD